MTTNAIILRRDFQRVRWRCLARIRKGKIRAEIEDDRSHCRVIDALAGKVDFYSWSEDNQKETEEICIAIVKEWGKHGISEDEVVRRFKSVLITGTLRQMVERGEAETRSDSYGRTSYRSLI